MSDSEDNITPFRLPDEGSAEPRETFGERLRRRRRELSSGEESSPPASWQNWSRNLFAVVVGSPHAAASITKKNGDEARAVDGISSVIFSTDLPPFKNSLGEAFSGEPLLAEDEIYYLGQPIALVVGKDEATCHLAASKLDIDYHTSPPVLTLDHAIGMEQFHEGPRECSRGDAASALRDAPETISGTFLIPRQSISPPLSGGVTVRPIDRGSGYSVRIPSLLPTSVRKVVAIAADLPESEIHLESVDLPGVTGALESEPVRLAALATHAAVKCGSAVTLTLSPNDRVLHTGNRHETRADFKVGFDGDGVIKAIDLRLTLDGGWYVGDSGTAMDRALLHADAVYGIPHLQLRARLTRTNRAVTSCLPAEGASQGSWAIEEVIQRVAGATGQSAVAIREKNFYQQESDLKTAPYGQPVNAKSISRVWQQVMRRSGYTERREAVEKWNRTNASYKRGIAITPIKFGIGDPRADRNAAAVIVQILGDGSINVRAGLVDANDGLADQIREEVSHRLGVEENAIRVILNDFDALPRATAVTGTDGSGLILRAIDQACQSLVARLREVALQLFAARGQTEIELESIRFANGLAGPDVSPTNPLHFKEVVEGAWRKRVNLIETGYHRTPNLWWDPDLGAGWPFSAFTYAAAVTELQIDAFTGEVQILRVDLAHEGSPSPDQAERDYAQLVRAFRLGMDWILNETPDESEEHSASFQTSMGKSGFTDAPFAFVTDRLRPLGDSLSVPGDPCGEAPVLLAGSVREAYREALRGFGLKAGFDIEIPFPATPSATLTVLKKISQAARGDSGKAGKTGSSAQSA